MKIDVSRPTISNWEKGKILPTTEQLMKISKAFNQSIDELCGINVYNNNWVLPDTSVLVNRPNIISDLIRKYDRVIISEVVRNELDNIKDRKKEKRGLSQQAWLALKCLSEERKKSEAKIIIEEDCVPQISKPDDKIISLAKKLARENSHTMVYVLSNDVTFSLQKIEPGVRYVSLQDFDKESAKELSVDLAITSDFQNAVKNKKLETAQKIYSKHKLVIDPNRCFVDTGFTPLIQAIRNKDKAMVSYLLSLSNLDINRKDDAKYSLTPLSHAIQTKQYAMVNLLIENGCDINLGSSGKNYGNTPLMIAAWHGLEDITRVLIDNGACLNQQDANGFTPLIKACIKKMPHTAKLLLEKTDLNIRSRENKTAKDYALESGNSELKELFTGMNYD